MIRRRLAGVVLAVARFFDLIDPARQPADRGDVFSDETSERLIETTPSTGVHADPGGCRCTNCLAGIEFFRRIVAAQADLNELRQIEALPLYERDEA